MKDKKYLYQGLTMIISISIVVLGWVYLVQGTSIGTDIETVNLLATGTSTMATTTIGTNFYIDEAGNASTTGYFNLADASTTGTFIVGGASTLTGNVTMPGNASVVGTFTAEGESNLSTLVLGGATTSVASTTDTGPLTVQLTAANFCDNSIIFFADEAASATTMYMPSASQLIGDCIPAVGDTKSTFLIFETVDTASTTITASTSINMLKSAGEIDLILDSAGGAGADGNQAIITCYNRNGTEVDCIFKSLIAGD